MQATYLKDVLKRKTTLNDPESLYDGTNFWKTVSQDEGNKNHGEDEEQTSDAEASLKPAFKTLILRVLIIIIYMCLGALVFCAIEYKNTNKTIWKRKSQLIKSRLMVKYNITLAELDSFEDSIEKRLKETKDANKEWSYYQSLYFASTVTTTIGYGHLTPQTQAGRLFLIVFALIGIPLNILALATVGEHITIGICYGISRLSRLCCKKRTVRHINIKVMIVSITLMVIMLFTGGALYVTTESWTYIDSIYYCFVALATIGFGDLVPNDGQAPGSAFEKSLWGLRVLYISIGLSLVSTVFTAISNAIEEINDLLGWPKKGEDEEEESPPSQRQSRREGNFKSRSFKLPNHITYRTEEEELQENLANALPFPGIRPDCLSYKEDNDNNKIRSRSLSRVEQLKDSEKFIDDKIKPRKRSQAMIVNGDIERRRNTIPSLKERNHLDSEICMEEDHKSHNITQNNDDEKQNNFRNRIKRHIDFDDVQMTIDKDEICRNGSLKGKFELRSVISSENDGYESSHYTTSENSSNLVFPDSVDHPNTENSILDIESQISDFPHCTSKIRPRNIEQQTKRKRSFHSTQLPNGFISTQT